jgi:putative component of membrane protein insertase Oxa1/YidC/SpoIIIJ protein YidD
MPDILKKTGGVMLLVFLFIPGTAFAEDPYEPGERIVIFRQEREESVTDVLVDFYQNVLSANTISRCPFHTSCSYYAQQQVDNHGWVIGALYFIDRYFYREHSAAFQFYPRKKNKDGVYKINDDWYLEN